MTHPPRGKVWKQPHSPLLYCRYEVFQSFKLNLRKAYFQFLLSMLTALGESIRSFTLPKVCSGLLQHSGDL